MIEYKTIDKLNQSLLKEILKSPGAFLRAQERYKEETTTPAHYVFGSAVDHLVTEDIDFTDSFYIMGESSVSDSIKKIIDIVYEEVKDENFSLSESYESIVRACSYEQYGQSWKEETRIKKILEQGSDYFKALKESVGKIVIFSNDYSKAVIAHAALISDPYISLYLKPREGQELVKKKVIEFTYEDIEMKCELDLVFIDHNTQEITPIDLKTIGTTIYNFSYNFWKYRYDLQAAVYDFAVRQSLKKVPNLENYKVNFFKFFVVEKDAINSPMIFTTDESILKKGYYGGTLSNGREIEGFFRAMERYKYHITTDKWNYPMEYYEQKGEIILTI